ncbi:MAG: FAD-dependent thymidylate synthase [Thermoplasmata archaeon]
MIFSRSVLFLLKNLIKEAFMLQAIQQNQKELIGLVLENMVKEWVSGFLGWSYLGARICYGSKHPLLIFQEERFQNKQKAIQFLFRLKVMGHFSVFAHTPIYVNIKSLSIEEKFRMASSFFKVWWCEDYAIFNLRHIAENLDSTAFLQFLNQFELSLEGFKIFRVSDSDVECIADLFKYIERIKEKYSKSLVAKHEVYILVPMNKELPYLWFGVLVHNFSRIFSHQFVRHTWLNFNQRSNRYTPVDKFVIPYCFNSNHCAPYLDIIKQSLNLYKTFSKDMKRENARFVLPQGSATTIFATAPDFVWWDFIQKRAIPQAQDEIRKLAIILKRFFEDFLNNCLSLL